MTTLTMTPPPPTVDELLAHYLPTKNGRTPPERLRAIAGKALADGRKRHPLTPTQAEDAYSHLLEIGLEATLEYNPALDDKPHIALDTRFGRFAYIRMRQRLIDWHRKHIHDPRPGKSDRRTVSHEDHDLPDTTPDFTDLIASQDRIQRWNTAATILGFDVTTWILTTLDTTATAAINRNEDA